MTQHDLKPCPFCGGEAQRITIGEEEPNNAGGDVIVCKDCQACSRVEFGRKENLVSAWNRRPTPAGDAVERVARMMNENIEAREIAKQEDADAYDDSEPRVQDYWQALARAAIAAIDPTTLKGRSA
jgi:Lar family restriction alleviation protein